MKEASYSFNNINVLIGICYSVEKIIRDYFRIYFLYFIVRWKKVKGIIFIVISKLMLKVNNFATHKKFYLIFMYFQM